MDIYLILGLMLIVSGGSGFICYYAGVYHERHQWRNKSVREILDGHNDRMGL